MNDKALKKTFHYTRNLKRVYNWLLNGYEMIGFNIYGQLLHFSFNKNNRCILCDSSQYQLSAGSLRLDDFSEFVAYLSKHPLSFIVPSK